MPHFLIYNLQLIPRIDLSRADSTIRNHPIVLHNGSYINNINTLPRIIIIITRYP